MEEYFIEHDILARFVNGLLSQKYPDGAPADIDKIREDGIRELSDKIATKIYGSLNESQLIEVNKLFDDQEEDPAVFQDFFKKSGINLNQKITEAAEEFGKEFLGGKND